MDSYKVTFETWNKVASLYQEKFMGLKLYNDSYDRFCNSIDINRPHIFEIGCGPGNITKYLLSKRPDFNLFGIDIAPNMIELARTHNPLARFDQMDARNISNVKSTFDGIICGFCLPYLSPSDSEKFITDCSLLLHKNGCIYLSFVEGDPARSGFQTGTSGDRTYFYFYELETIKRILQSNHFEILEILKLNYERSKSETELHTIIIAKK